MEAAGALRCSKQLLRDRSSRKPWVEAKNLRFIEENPLENPLETMDSMDFATVFPWISIFLHFP